YYSSPISDTPPARTRCPAGFLPPGVPGARGKRGRVLEISARFGSAPLPGGRPPPSSSRRAPHGQEVAHVDTDGEYRARSPPVTVGSDASGQRRATNSPCYPDPSAGRVAGRH